jgi:Domain of unknown function (DUF6456)
MPLFPAAQRSAIPAADGKAARRPQPQQAEIDCFRGRHLALARRQIATELGRLTVTVDEAESPLAWLARRQGRNGRAMIEAHQLQAGERLRADFTRAHLMPRTTSNWASAIATERRGDTRAVHFTDAMIAAQQDVNRALEAAGPEFAGLLVDVCCFLKGLADIEHERTWPVRSAKVVLQLGLERLARHYGYGQEARGPARSRLRIWLAEDAAFSAAAPLDNNPIG